MFRMKSAPEAMKMLNTEKKKNDSHISQTSSIIKKIFLAEDEIDYFEILVRYFIRFNL